MLFRSKRTTGIKQASSSETWDELKTAYGARYPYNHVVETEAGHIVEMDSTPNQERLHIYHKSGTYIEIDVNGTVVKKTIGDDYEVVDRNGYLYVKGAYSITASGPTKILVQNNADIEVDGDTNITSHGSTLVQSAQTLQMVADDIIINGKSSVQITSDGQVDIDRKSTRLNSSHT